jgi:RNA polymerase sigma-70 factor (sigma-E family)
MSARKPDAEPARPEKVTETLVADTARGPVTARNGSDPGSADTTMLDGTVLARAGLNGSDVGSTISDLVPDIAVLGAAAPAAAAVPRIPVLAHADADTTIAVLYGLHYRSLVRLAALLVHDIATAEEVVQDSFVALHAGLHRLRDSEKTLSYLRAAVVNRARSVLRHRVVVDRNAPKPAPDMPSAELGALALIERSSVVKALRSLPGRQREVVVLRFYADMSEAQIAAAMGITRGAVKSHTSRAMAALRSVLERDA